MKNLNLFLLCLILLTSCVSSYAPWSITGGYSDETLGPDLYKVGYRGNGYTKIKRGEDYAFLHAAELCLETEKRYFVIIQTNTYIEMRDYVNPETDQKTEVIKYYARGPLPSNQSAVYTGSSTARPTRPVIELIVMFIEDYTDMDATVFDAEYIKTNLTEKYKR